MIAFAGRKLIIVHEDKIAIKMISTEKCRALSEREEKKNDL